MSKSIVPVSSVKPRYSGPLSEAFWREVWGLTEPDHSVAYALGVALQDLEDFVLKHLREARRKSAVPAKQRTAKKKPPAPDPYIDPKTGLCRVCAEFRKPGTKGPHNTRRSCAVCAAGSTRRHQHWLPDVEDHELSGWSRRAGV